MPEQKITANLHRGYQVGRVINYGGGLYQIKAHNPQRGLWMLPGGAGIIEMELELVEPINPHKYPTKKDVWECELQLTGKTPEWDWRE